MSKIMKHLEGKIIIRIIIKRFKRNKTKQKTIRFMF